MGKGIRKGLIWTIVFLLGSYLVAQAIADVSATKFIDLFGVALPAGSFIFAITFTLRDLIHKRLGKEWAVATIVAAAVFNVAQAIYLTWVAGLPSPEWVDPKYTEAWSQIMIAVPAITIASITAEVISQLTDTQVYHWIAPKFTGIWEFMRVLISNAVSLPVDSFVFATLAFVVLPPLFGQEALPMQAALALVMGQIVWKAVVTVVSMPLIYLVPDRKIEF